MLGRCFEASNILLSWISSHPADGFILTLVLQDLVDLKRVKIHSKYVNVGWCLLNIQTVNYPKLASVEKNLYL